MTALKSNLSDIDSVVVTLASLSLIGSTFVLFTCCFFYAKYKTSLIVLIAWLSLFQMILYSAVIGSVVNNGTKNNKISCDASAVAINYSNLATICTATTLAYANRQIFICYESRNTTKFKVQGWMFVFSFIFPLIAFVPLSTNSFGTVNGQVTLPFCELGLDGDEVSFWWSLFAASVWEIFFALTTTAIYCNIFLRILRSGLVQFVQFSWACKFLLYPLVTIFCWVPEFLWLYSKQYGFDSAIPEGVQYAGFYLWLSAGLLYATCFAIHRRGLLAYESWAAVREFQLVCDTTHPPTKKLF